jgi:hypothetical protein
MGGQVGIHVVAKGDGSRGINTGLLVLLLLVGN